MRVHFERAISNIIKHGDTDIFPYPVENLLFYDKKADSIDLLLAIDKQFEENLTRFPPANHNALAPISYPGFRWATQIDPLWNAYFLGLVVSISEQIEKARLPKVDGSVFSYRIEWDENDATLFDKNYNWRTFMEHSLSIASESKFVVVCDISEFYPRLNHHRLENALKQLNLKGDQPHKIMQFLSNFSDTYSFGIPIGGPASRILSELLLNQVDRLLKAEGIFEIKAGDRNVRSVDLRQLLVYSALNYADQKRQIQRIGLFNPRVGTHFSATLDEFCAEISGRPTIELLSEIVQVFSSGDISR
jgi:hypothetical protein